jgi:Asp/Glu/hydantoin racemase
MLAMQVREILRMEKKIVVIHTSFISVDTLKSLFGEIIPEAKVYNIVDDSMLPEIMSSCGVTENVIKRYCAYARQAEVIGADLIFSQCSSAGPAADAASKLIKTPILKVDQAMAEEAVNKGKRIAVVATIGTTLKPSVELIEKVALEKNKQVSVDRVLLESAYEALFLKNDKKLHNKIILDKIHSIEHLYDVIVLAQGSMVTLLDELSDVSVLILTSPRLGVLRARDVLGL